MKPRVGDLGNLSAWFQENGAVVDTARKSFKVWRELIPGHVISLSDVVQWDARSSGIAPWDFFL